MDRHEVVQSGVWNTNVSGIEVTDNHLVMLVDGEGLMTVALGENFATINALTFLVEADPVLELKAAGPGVLLCRRTRIINKNLDKVTIDFDNLQCLEVKSAGGFYTTYPLMRGINKSLYFRGDGFFYSIDSEGNIKSLGAVPEPILNDIVSIYSGCRLVQAENCQPRNTLPFYRCAPCTGHLR